MVYAEYTGSDDENSNRLYIRVLTGRPLTSVERRINSCTIFDCHRNDEFCSSI